ncbi:MAG: pilin [Acidiferrobacteraceae bacterium]
MRCSVSSGFTLIELMIVVTIIGILAAIAIPSYEDYIVRAKLTEGFSLAEAAEIAVSDTYQTNGYFPAGNNTTYGLALAPSFNGRYVSALSVNSQPLGGSNSAAGTPPIIAVQYRTGLGGFPGAGGTVLTFTATPAIGAISWVCGYGSIAINGTIYTSTGTTVPALYLPPNCR